MRSTRYDSYCFAPVKLGVSHFGKEVNAPIVKDTWYPIIPYYREALLRSITATTSANLTGASLKFALMRNNEVVVATVLGDQSIATAITGTALTVGAMFTTHKPSVFTLGDVVLNTPALSAVIKDFSELDLAFQVTGADVPDALRITFEYQFTYIA